MVRIRLQPAWFAALLCALPVAAVAAELQVFAAGAVQTVLQETGAQFERDSGHRLKFAFGTVGALRDRITGGEAADVTVLSTPAIAELDRRTLTAAEPRSTVGTVSSGIAIRAGTPKPKLGTPEELKATLLAARSIAYGDPARGATAGIHFAGVLKQLGIAEAMQPKTILVAFGMDGIHRVAKGESELAVSQASEILGTPGVELAGLLPPPLRSSTTYLAAPLAKAQQPDAAAAYVRFLASAPVVARFRALGFEAAP